MKIWKRCVALVVVMGLDFVAAQEVRVRAVDEVAMPTQVDSNSPAFWRGSQLFWFGSHGRPWLSSGPNQFGPWKTSEVDFRSLYAMPHWMEAVWSDDDGTLWGWYHSEPIGLFGAAPLTAPNIGAVVSFDGGKTILDLGIVLETGDALEPTAQNGYFGGGHGDCSVILDQERKFFLFPFRQLWRRGGEPGRRHRAPGVCGSV